MRDWFAAMALQGLLHSHGGGDIHAHYMWEAGSFGDNNITSPKAIAQHCYTLSDAMLAARKEAE